MSHQSPKGKVKNKVKNKIKNEIWGERKKKVEDSNYVSTKDKKKITFNLGDDEEAMEHIIIY